MTQDDIFSIAFACFNYSYMEKKGKGSREEMFAKQFLPKAEMSAARLHEWSFLMCRYKYSDSELKSYEPVYGHMKYIYDRPSDMLSLYAVNGKYNATVRALGQDLFFDDKNPEITYMTNKINYKQFDSLYPIDFGYLIAYELAFELSDQIMPEKREVKASIAQKIEMTARLLRQSDLENLRDENVVPEWMEY